MEGTVRNQVRFIFDANGVIVGYKNLQTDQDEATFNLAQTATTWAARGSGDAVGRVIRISDVGNNPLLRAEWDGTRWVPHCGRQLLYQVLAPVNGSAGASSTATSASISIPAGMLGVCGGLEIVADFAGNTAPVAAIPQVAWGGNNTFDGLTVGTRRNVRVGRNIKNINSASSQIVSEGVAETGGFGSANGAAQAFSVDTTAAVAVQVSINMTHATSIVATINKLQVWWVGG